jgi:hypothetical protein
MAGERNDGLDARYLGRDIQRAVAAVLELEATTKP